MKSASILLTGVFFIAFFSDCYAIPPGGRQRLLIDQGWKFSFTDTVGADRAAFNDSKWRSLNLPHDWSIENAFMQNAPTGGGGGYLPTGIGWYRKHFVLPKSAVAKNVWVEFDGVYQNAEVWFNGHYLGRRPNGYISFVCELTPFIKKGENIISVKVDNSIQPNSRWYSGSGIYRHVWLYIANPLHIAQWGTYITTPQVDPASSLIFVKTTIENKNSYAVSAILRSILLDPEGKEVARKESAISLSPDNSFTSDQQFSVGSPQLWSLVTPYLYILHSFILSQEKIIDSTVSTFGIRTIVYDADEGFLLNGKHVKMNGVCLHHDGGSVGAAVPEAIWVSRLQLLKEMGCNAIRTSHNPPAPEFLDLCDRMGFLVMDEAFDVWESGKVKNDYHLYFDEWSQKDLTDQIRRDRNHPSVVIWSAGNEIPDQKSDRGVDLLKGLQAIFHKEDPSRPMTTANDDIAADNGATSLAFMEAEDIVGYNYVDRWHERRELFYSIDRHDHPAWKMIGTESVAIAGIRGNYFGGHFFHPDSSIIKTADLAEVVRAEQLWKYVSVHDYVIGDFMWTGIDYLGEARWPFRSSSSGVIDLCGFPKDAYYFYQSQWTQKPMIHLLPHWNWKGKEGTIIQVMAYTNCDSVELFLDGKSFGIKSLEFPRQGNSGGWNKYDRPPVGITTGDLHLVWDVPYQPGILKAIGRKAGKIACEEEIRTSEVPAAIRLSVDRSSIHPVGDAAQIKIEILDKNGYLVPDADNQIQLVVEGVGSLLGFDNGNPADHGSMKDNRRKAFNGLALAVIGSNGGFGDIHVRAESEGIKSVSLEISVKQINAPAATLR
jgi:beta-galactosidase